MRTTDATLITTAEVLADACEHWAGCSWLSLDTEFVREDTYYPKLCLVQVGDGETEACVDALALDLAPLFAALQAPGVLKASVLKVFHAAGQDLEIFVQHTGDCPRPLFDTQIAASLLGYGEQLGYAALVTRMLGVELDKSLARTDWTRRPLPEAALRYAADDVRYLAEIYERLAEALERRGRRAWLDEDCARLTDPALYQTRPEDAWRRVRGLGRLPGAAQHRAARLAQWREQEAQSRNRPRRWILDDETLLALALSAPAGADALRSIPGVTLRLAARYGEIWLALLQAPVADDAPLAADKRLEPEQKAQVQRAIERLRAIAQAEDITPSLIASRADLEALVLRGEAAGVPLLGGWRRAVAGDAVLAVLSG